MNKQKEKKIKILQVKESEAYGRGKEGKLYLKPNYFFEGAEIGKVNKITYE